MRKSNNLANRQGAVLSKQRGIPHKGPNEQTKVWKKDWGRERSLVRSLSPKGEDHNSGTSPVLWQPSHGHVYRAEHIEYRGRTRKYPGKLAQCVSTGGKP